VLQLFVSAFLAYDKNQTQTERLDRIWASVWAF
jgi:hypothetical protein